MVDHAHVFRGCMPAVMTPCFGDRSPNFDALVDTARQLIAAGMGAVVYCGSMGDWPLLRRTRSVKKAFADWWTPEFR